MKQHYSESPQAPPALPKDGYEASSMEHDAVAIAGNWLSTNRAAVVGPIIPFLRVRFQLTNLQAIEATKLARALQVGAAREG